MVEQQAVNLLVDRSNRSHAASSLWSIRGARLAFDPELGQDRHGRR
jgi:hypothetical protein